MTIEHAQQLGIWTAWGFVSCQVCCIYTSIADLTEQNGLVYCPKCKKDIEGKKDAKSQQSLFDEQTRLF